MAPAQASTRTSSETPAGSARLGAADWVETGLMTLARGNVDDVRVEVIARELKVTKGSFYWHFKNRQDLLERILDHWTEWATVQITRWARSEGESARDRLVWLLTLPARSRPDKHGADIELAIRNWARQDPLAAETVRRVDAMRAEFFGELLARPGLDAETLAERVAIAQAFMLGEALLKTGGDREHRIRAARACARLITED